MIKTFQTFLISVLLMVSSLTFAQGETQEFALPPMQMGETLLKMGQFEGAEAIYSKLFETGAENPYVVRGLVKAKAGLKKIEEVTGFLEEYLKKNPDSSSVLYGLGLASFINKNSEKAESYLNRAIEKNSQNSPAYNTLAVLYFDKNDYQNAIKKLQTAIDKSPGDLLVYRNLLRTYQAMGKEETFLKEFEAAKAQKSRANTLGYGRAYAAYLRQEGFKAYGAGNVNKTFEQMTAMLKVYQDIKHPTGEVSALFSLALLEEERGQKNAALEHYRKLLKINPDHIQARERIKEIEQGIKNQ
ncbi:MAG: tetratricopeptide repeat protein [Candidatus Nitronauta litoralis]|uniref:Tetratricopeptide repeat protein n=1 Tax=Candidatus Nitronauta litoralis TaxID=2705533 RepID=A0A7T0BZ11_9BACT|nr:MAG: tetratricopeptide repeat protein [Candidatus Nitronauta litoralis]